MSFRSDYRKLIAKYLPEPISSETQYRQALAQLEELMVPHPGRARSLLIEVLSVLIEDYESRRHPTPDVPPHLLLKELITARAVSPAALSRATGIPAATISSVLACRRGISKQSAVKLGHFFGISPAAFLAADAPRPSRAHSRAAGASRP